MGALFVFWKKEKGAQGPYKAKLVVPPIVLLPGMTAPPFAASKMTVSTPQGARSLRNFSGPKDPGRRPLGRRRWAAPQAKRRAAVLRPQRAHRIEVLKMRAVKPEATCDPILSWKRKLP